MKILHLINDLSSGGAESLLKEIVPLQKKYDDISILTLSNEKSVFDEELKKNKVNIINTKFTNNVYNPLQIFEIYKHIKEYDIIHVHLFPSFYWAALANLIILKNKTKLIVTEHNTSNNRRDKKIFKAIDKFIYKRYEKIVCISDEVKNELLKWLDNELEDRMITINNGINLEKFKKAKPYNQKEIINNYKEDDVLLLMIARFNKQKDHETVIKCLNELPEKYKLVLVGEGDRLNIIKSMVSELNLDDRVQFLGFRNDIPRIIKTCDISILSSHYEGFGLAAVESMASGIPTIVSDVEGLRDIVSSGGIIFNKSNYKDLKLKIIQVNEDKTIYKDISENGKVRAESYDLENMIIKLNKLYKSNDI